MSKKPLFIMSDNVRLRREGLQKAMMIERFQTERVNGSLEYTGFIECFWCEGGKLHREIFNEKDLEKAN